MEIFDPVTNEVRLIVDALPPEVISSSSYNRLNMISVEDNTELIIIGGQTSGMNIYIIPIFSFCEVFLYQCN